MPYNDAYFGDPETWLEPADTFKIRQGKHIDCRHCGYYGRSEIGLVPRPGTRKAPICPSCRGPA